MRLPWRGVDRQRVRRHRVGAGGDRTQRQSHDVVVMLRLPASTAGPSVGDLHRAEGRLELLGEPHRDLSRRGADGAADARIGVIEDRMGHAGIVPSRSSAVVQPNPAQSHGHLQTSARRAGAAEDRLADGGREHVVEIEVELRHRADAGAAGAIDRNDRLEADLEVFVRPR